MRLSISRLFAFGLAITLASCGGAASPPPTLPSTVPALDATYAAPLDISVPVAQLPAARLTNDLSKRPPLFDARHAALASANRELPLSSIPASEHGSEGIGIDAGGPYRALYAIHSAYDASAITFAPGQAYTLFAPTSHMSNGSCLEVGNAYYTDANGNIVAQFYVFDFCLSQPTYAFLATIDDQFESNYVRVVNKNKGSGLHQKLPYYITEIVATPKNSRRPLDANTTWTALLYNHTTGSWDRVYSDTGSTGATSGGWSIFEDYFPAGPCPSLGPTFAADALKLYNEQTRQWELLAPQMARTTTSVNPFAQSSCFCADSTGPASYGFDLEAPNSEWAVTE